MLEKFKMELSQRAKEGKSSCVILRTKQLNTYAGVIYEPKRGRFSVLVECRERLGAVKLNALIDLGDELMGVSPILRYEIYAEEVGKNVTIYEWRKGQENVDAFLAMMANSNGFVRDGYSEIIPLSDTKLANYANRELRQFYANYVIERRSA